MTSWDHLSDSQRAAALHDAGPAAVYAGPGSGKTRVVTLRAARLAAQGRRLLVTTFTNDATEEMRTRLGQLLPKDRLEATHCTTLHSLCLKILRESGAKFQLATDEALRRNLAEACRASELEGGVGGFLSRLSYQKNLGHKASAYTHDGSSEDMEFARVWRAYEKAKTEKGLREFDDLVLDALALLETDESLRRGWAARYTHVIVDECQDMNAPQYGVVFALGRDHKNVMLVGDLDQSLYAFRGADSETFRRFAANPRALIFELRENYRCTRAILTFADSLIRQDTQRRALIFVPTRPEGEPVTWQRFPDADVEALAVGEQILRLNRSGVRFADMAVLYRANAQSEAFERHFSALEIPYNLRDSGNFYARREVQGILAYLHLFSEGGEKREEQPLKIQGGTSREANTASYPDEWLLAILNVPDRKMSRGTGADLINHAEIRGRRIWDILPEFRAADLKSHRALRLLTQELKQIQSRLEGIADGGEAIRIVRAATQFDDWLRRSEGGDRTEDRDNDRIQNLQRMQEAASHYPRIADYLDAVQKVRDNQERRKAAARKRGQRDEVTLGTGHGAKGLEWRCVFAVGWSEDLLPHRKAEEMDEERRVAYVIATRARDLLRVSSLDRWNEATCAPSRFLTGLQIPPAPPPGTAGTKDTEGAETKEILLPTDGPLDTYGGLFLAP